MLVGLSRLGSNPLFFVGKAMEEAKWQTLTKDHCTTKGSGALHRIRLQQFLREVRRKSKGFEDYIVLGREARFHEDLELDMLDSSEIRASPKCVLMGHNPEPTRCARYTICL